MGRTPKPRVKLGDPDPDLGKEANDLRRAALLEVSFARELVDLEPAAQVALAADIRAVLLQLPGLRSRYNFSRTPAGVENELAALQQRVVDSIGRLAPLPIAGKLERINELLNAERLSYQAKKRRGPTAITDLGQQMVAVKLERLLQQSQYAHLNQGPRRQLVLRIIKRSSKALAFSVLPHSSATHEELDAFFTTVPGH